MTGEYINLNAAHKLNHNGPVHMYMYHCGYGRCNKLCSKCNTSTMVFSHSVAGSGSYLVVQCWGKLLYMEVPMASLVMNWYMYMCSSGLGTNDSQTGLYNDFGTDQCTYDTHTHTHNHRQTDRQADIEKEKVDSAGLEPAIFGA